MSTNDLDYPMRQITDRRYFEPAGARPNTGSVELTLECGHKTKRRQSSEPVSQCRCEQCYYDQSVT